VVLARPVEPSPGYRALQFLLGLALTGWGSGFRAFHRSFLQHAPFQLCADDRTFDTEMLIQARILSAPCEELTLPHARSGGADADWSAWQNIRAALRYRLHQLHFTRRGQFLADPRVRYQFKHSPYSSHRQILAAIEPGSRVLDLGCSQGLLAEHLSAVKARVTGVDVQPASSVSTRMERYHQHDLELPLDLPEGRSFDYVVVADVIEHVRRRTELLRSARRHLTSHGRLIISTGNIAIWFYRLSLLAGRFEYGPRGILDETHVHLFTRATFRREVERGGFRVVRERVTALPFELVFESTGQSRLIRGLSAAYHKLAQVWPEMFAYQFILEAEVTTLHDPAVTTHRVQQ
jgi:2-polyprenyl-3-methyl-5-hydroxy-6-metoxy-1,4-benzoquinol methylase